MDELGSGQFGMVSKGVWDGPLGAMDVAVKQLQFETSEEERVMFLQEAAINGQFHHPNVVQLVGVVTIGEPVCLHSSHVFPAPLNPSMYTFSDDDCPGATTKW